MKAFLKYTILIAAVTISLMLITFQVANLWAKAEETRNGVLRYAVACNNLKEQL